MFASSKAKLKVASIKEPGKDDSRREVPLDDAVAAACKAIKQARHVVIAGCTHTSSEAQSLALQLATKLHASLAIPEWNNFTNVTESIKRSGMHFFTLGETINSADLIVFWGSNPVDLCPKLLVKTAFSRGRFRQSGKEVKKVAVIDEYPTPTMERADMRIALETREQEAFLAAVEKVLLEKGAVNAPDFQQPFTTFPPLSDGLQGLATDLANAIATCEYCTIFLGEGILNRQFLSQNPGFLARMLRLVNALDKNRRSGVLPLFYGWNFAGLARELQMAGNEVNVLDLQDFASDIGKEDVIIAIGVDIISKTPLKNEKWLNDASIIAIDFKRTPTTDMASIILPVAMTGAESGGIAVRLDGMTLLMNPPVAMKQGMKNDAEVLRQIIDST
jgi:formylmethanofuran dehydrogenase subunit B